MAFGTLNPMAVHLIVAKLLRDELALRGIRSLTIDESEAIAARIFERIAESWSSLCGTSTPQVRTNRADGRVMGRQGLVSKRREQGLTAVIGTQKPAGSGAGGV
ncbi:hypothetical protein [Bradyrhizobium sp. RDM4]|uniref:hypothetical protein n=1 Tax=Bradyrhizobium sp. RDM4 TaxID=3378765 RepID=UPI0038FC75D7